MEEDRDIWGYGCNNLTLLDSISRLNTELDRAIGHTGKNSPRTRRLLKNKAAELVEIQVWYCSLGHESYLLLPCFFEFPQATYQVFLCSKPGPPLVTPWSKPAPLQLQSLPHFFIPPVSCLPGPPLSSSFIPVFRDEENTGDQFCSVTFGGGPQSKGMAGEAELREIYRGCLREREEISSPMLFSHGERKKKKE
ncbi:hypothetical protein WMY93_009448 [Mugilogobius chulae]|uniref:Uncharacterized protein n=1 Tax=Mugilogobius chulae TaxID=88201 RepID=A0AAW0PBT8_9GOBI